MKKEKSKKFIALCKRYGVNPDLVPEILTYEEACKLTNRDPKADRDNLQKIIVVIEAYCQECKKWKADYDDTDQLRWFPVHRKTSSGLVFSCTLCENWISYSFAFVCAPFVLPNDDCAKFVGIHFLPLYSWKLKYKVK